MANGPGLEFLRRKYRIIDRDDREMVAKIRSGCCRLFILKNICVDSGVQLAL